VGEDALVGRGGGGCLAAFRGGGEPLRGGGLQVELAADGEAGDRLLGECAGLQGGLDLGEVGGLGLAAGLLGGLGAEGHLHIRVRRVAGLEPGVFASVGGMGDDFHEELF
jgi:hypothetical protein